MKALTTGFFAVITALGITAAVSSCSQKQRIYGQWMGESQNIILPGTADATATTTFDFAPMDKREGGKVNLSAVIAIVEPVSGIEGIALQFQANITATASVDAKYVYKDDDDDELVLVFDPSTLKVDIDPSDVVLSDNALTGTEKPTLDSLTAATTERWRLALTPVIRQEFQKYGRIDDMEFHGSDVMTCEIEHRKLTFHRVGTPD